MLGPADIEAWIDDHIDSQKASQAPSDASAASTEAARPHSRPSFGVMPGWREMSALRRRLAGFRD